MTPPADNSAMPFRVSDNLALRQIGAGEVLKQEGRFLDHFGFIAQNEAIVNQVDEKMKAEDVTIVKTPKRHRDGSCSFYMADPNGNVIQILYGPRKRGFRLTKTLKITPPKYPLIDLPFSLVFDIALLSVTSPAGFYEWRLEP